MKKEARFLKLFFCLCLIGYALSYADEEDMTEERPEKVERGYLNFVDLRLLIPTISCEIVYATSTNFLGIPVYSSADCYLHRDAANALKKVEADLQELGYSVKVFDGYRPLHVQQRMWDLVQDERYVSNPAKNSGRHTRGTAIDLTIVDQQGNELEMPTAFDDFTVKAHSFNEDVPKEAKKNRSLLQSVMTKHGFEIFEFEWWHFDLAGWKDDVKYPAQDCTFEELKVPT